MTHPATLLRDSLKAYGRNWKSWILMVVPLGALVAFFIAISVFVASDLRVIRSFLLTSIGAQATYLVFFFLIIATVFAAWTFVNASVYAAGKALEGAKAGFKEAYSRGLRVFWPVLWVSILRGLLILGGLILFIVPGIIWALRYSLVTQAVVIEGKRGMDAFRRSRELTSGRLLETAIDFGVLGAIVGYGLWIVMSATVFLLMILGYIAAAVLPQSAYSVAGIVMGVIIVIAEAAIVWAALPLSPIAFTSIYKDFSRTK